MARPGSTVLVIALACGWVPSAGAEPSAFDVSEILEAPKSHPLERVRTRITAYSQTGRGYQSQAGPRSGPGSQALTVFQTQAEFVARQDDAIVHRVWIPVDIVTSASAGANDRYYAEPDIVSTASVQNYAAEAEYQVGIQTSRDSTWTGGVALHNEEILWSWRFSLAYERALAEDNATVSVGINQVLDWFAEYELGGQRVGRTSRSSTNANLGLSQLLSPTTVAGVTYGLTLQRGNLGNAWNTVPTLDGERVEEAVPGTRGRHALAGTLAQWLPWRGALHLGYRAYFDDWSVAAHTIESRLVQRAGPWLTLGAVHRYHTQSAVSFFTTRGDRTARYLTADSDLAALSAHTLGAAAELELDARPLGSVHLSIGYDHYFRSNDLRVNIVTWASGLRF